MPFMDCQLVPLLTDLLSDLFLILSHLLLSQGVSAFPRLFCISVFCLGLAKGGYWPRGRPGRGLGEALSMWSGICSSSLAIRLLIPSPSRGVHHNSGRPSSRAQVHHLPRRPLTLEWRLPVLVSSRLHLWPLSSPISSITNHLSEILSFLNA